MILQTCRECGVLEIPIGATGTFILPKVGTLRKLYITCLHSMRDILVNITISNGFQIVSMPGETLMAMQKFLENASSRKEPERLTDHAFCVDFGREGLFMEPSIQVDFQLHITPRKTFHASRKVHICALYDVRMC